MLREGYCRLDGIMGQEFDTLVSLAPGALGQSEQALDVEIEFDPDIEASRMRSRPCHVRPPCFAST